MNMPDMDWSPLWLTMQLAGVTVVVLLIVGTPLAWWLAFTKSRVQNPCRGDRGVAHRSPADGPRILSAGRARATRPDWWAMEGAHWISAFFYFYRVGHRFDVLFASVCRAASAWCFRGCRGKTAGSGLVAARFKTGCLFHGGITHGHSRILECDRLRFCPYAR